jgi:hypothetical protein
MSFEYRHGQTGPDCLFNSNYFNERLKCPMFKLITPKLAKTDKGTEPNLEETTAHKMQDCQ